MVTKQKQQKQLEEGKIYCVHCDKEMKPVSLPSYEFEEGFTLHTVSGYKCSTCQKVFFTEEQAKEMEARTEEMKEYTFGFKRRVGVSGKSLVVTIPSELAEHIHINQGTEVKILPVSNDSFLVRKV